MSAAHRECASPFCLVLHRNLTPFFGGLERERESIHLLWGALFFFGHTSDVKGSLRFGSKLVQVGIVRMENMETLRSPPSPFPPEALKHLVPEPTGIRRSPQRAPLQYAQGPQLEAAGAERTGPATGQLTGVCPVSGCYLLGL